MNMEKTKVIWIGRKRCSKEKLNVSCNLQWGNHEFAMLGLNFSINLKEISNINYTRTLEKVRNEMGKWKYRYLTSFGRITLIKTMLTHLFLRVPAPPTVLQEINSFMFSFFWNNKPDKVKRNTICGDYLNGGLKMIHIFYFERALKLNWIGKVIHQTEASWKLLLLDSGYKLSNITLMGGSFPFIPQAPQNDFWQIVFEYWKDFSQKNRPKCNEDISQSSIWHNYQLSKYPLFLVSWYNKGIRLVGDILHEDGSIISHTELNSKYNFSSNIFDYQRTKLCTKKFIKIYQTNSKFLYERPNIPFHLKPLFISKSGTKDFYKILTDLETQEPSCRRVWEKSSTWRQMMLLGGLFLRGVLK